MPFFFGAAQFANLDMPVAACIALTIVFAADAALALRDGAPWRRTLVLAWACAALGVLAKGLIGIVLPGLVIVVWLVALRQAADDPAPALAARRRRLRRSSPRPGSSLVQERYPGSRAYFFVHHHFERFTAGGFNNPQPWWFYLVVLPALTLPWSLWLVRVRLAGAHDREHRRARLAHPDVDLARGRRRVLLLAAIEAGRLRHAGAVPARVPDRRAGARRLARRAHGGAPRRGAASAWPSRSAWSPSAWRRRATTATTPRSPMRCATARAPGDPVVFVDEYFFDVPLHARLRDPVPVIADWHDPDIVERDNWRRELAEAAPFAPERAAALLVDARQGFRAALRQGAALGGRQEQRRADRRRASRRDRASPRRHARGALAHRAAGLHGDEAAP